jgi:hypothetical protein
MSIQGAHWLRTVAANWHTQEDKPWSIQFTSCRQMDKTCTRICFVCLLALPTAARWGDQMRRRRTAHWMGQEEIILRINVNQEPTLHWLTYGKNH